MWTFSSNYFIIQDEGARIDFLPWLLTFHPSPLPLGSTLSAARSFSSLQEALLEEKAHI